MTLPEPLVPPNADLRDFPFMPLEIERLRRSKSWLIAKRKPEIGFYMLNLWMGVWHNLPAGSVEDDDDMLADLAMCDPKRWLKVKDDVLRGWVKCSDERLYHPVVAEKVLDAWGRKQQQRERSRRGNEARWGARNNRPDEPAPRAQGGAVQDGSVEDHARDGDALPEGVLEGLQQGFPEGPPEGVPERSRNDPKRQGHRHRQEKEPPPSPSGALKRRSPDDPAVVVAKAFVSAKDARWPEHADRVAPRQTLETLAQQHLDAGATVDLLTELIERSIRDWKNPTPPTSLAALKNSLADRVAQHRRALEAPPPQPGQSSPPAAPFDRHAQTRQRMRVYARTRTWDAAWGPELGHPLCQIPPEIVAECVPWYGLPQGRIGTEEGAAS